MQANLDGAKVFDGIDFDTACYQFTRYFAADILFCGRNNIGFRSHDAALVMIEFDIFGKIRSIRVEVFITGIIGSKKNGINVNDFLIKFEIVWFVVFGNAVGVVFIGAAACEVNSE